MTHDAIIWQGITAVVTILTVVAAYLKNRADRKVDHHETTAKLDKVQTTVNGEKAALQARVEQLSTTIASHGIDPPPPQTETG